MPRVWAHDAARALPRARHLPAAATRVRPDAPRAPGEAAAAPEGVRVAVAAAESARARRRGRQPAAGAADAAAGGSERREGQLVGAHSGDSGGGRHDDAREEGDGHQRAAAAVGALQLPGEPHALELKPELHLAVQHDARVQRLAAATAAPAACVRLQQLHAAGPRARDAAIGESARGGRRRWARGRRR